ncbi:hypothetical protein [Helicobacter mesocricetorum]|uniref:hypothetical protein n=1 Tax=Helicobacter mesocricetorum TaxID=87012 RepID=UPI000CF15EBD|nr:hypothetical protein [Helicobacter mesocricetorum]
MKYSGFFLVLVILVAGLVALVGCQGDVKESINQESPLKEGVQKNNKKSLQAAPETLLKKETQQGLKQHLDNLNSQLQQKNLRNLQLDSAGFKKHQQHFEDFYNRKDLSESSPNNPKGNFDKALQKQLKQIEKLNESNDKFGR